MIRGQAPKCFLCGKQIQGKYYYDWEHHCVCAHHTIVRCASCGQFCNSRSKDIGMGLRVCSHCIQYRVEREDGRRIIDYIQGIYERTPMGRINVCHLKMVDAETLYQMTSDINARGLARSVDSDYTIFIYRELSCVSFAQVLAHEMLHIYQYSHHIHPEKSKCEGFCNLGSYVVLKVINNKEAKAAIDTLLANPDPVYGDGFRHLLAIYKQGGWEACIKEIKQ